MSNVPVIRPRPHTPSLLEAMQALAKGDWSLRLSADGRQTDFATAQAYNALADLVETLVSELSRVREQVGKQGLHGERVRMAAARGGWAEGVGAVNGLLDDLLGALAQRMDLDLRVDQLLSQSQALVVELRAQQEALAKLSQRAFITPLSTPFAPASGFPSPPPATENSPPVPQGAIAQAPAGKVLVLAEDESARFRITTMLSQRGFQPLVADTGKDGLELLLANTDVALVLVDVDAHGVKGTDTVHIIRGLKEFQRLPIIAMGAEQGGASDQLPKPVNPEQLAALLQAWASS